MEKVNNSENDRENSILLNNLQNLFIFSENKIKIPNKIYGYQKFNQNQKDVYQNYIYSIIHKFNLSTIQKEKITIYSKTYTKDILRKLIYSIAKILYFSYKKNFPKIKNSNTNKIYTSDKGWGCMIRCGQMILSRGIYKYFKKLKFDTLEALNQSWKFFYDNIIELNEFPEEFFNMMNLFIKNYKINKQNHQNLIGCFPPFSIKSICLNGILCHKFAGDWFSDVNLCYLFHIISEKYNLFKNLKIFSFHTQLFKEEIIKGCFTKINNTMNNNEYIEFENEKYYFKNMGIIFISVRLGIEKISIEYHKSLRKFFLCKENIGIIGGIKNLAYYFIGYKDDGELLYLDPHSTKECSKYIFNNNINHYYLCSNVKSLEINKMTTALSFGFIFRDLNEFNDLFKFFDVHMKYFEFPLFGVSDKNIMDNFNYDMFKNKVNMDNDDF